MGKDWKKANQLGNCGGGKSLQSCPTLCNPIDYSQTPLSMGFSRQK